jgi:hypothetical protein
MGGNYSQSVASFAEYLDKENKGKPLSEREAFFNQHADRISRFKVIEDIDSNTRKLKRREPKFYSITINPSFLELKAIENNKEALKTYTKKVMEDYVASFHKTEINGKKLSVNDIVYYAKLEHERTFKYTDKYVKENLPYIRQLRTIQTKANAVQMGKATGNLAKLKQKYQEVYANTPHKQQGLIIEAGMKKEGPQSHIHIIVSRKDRSNRYSLSPGSKHKASTVELNGKEAKRGFNRDLFMEKAEQRFDTLFGLQRNYVISYKGRKELALHPVRFFSQLAKLPTNEKAAAIQFLKAHNTPGIAAVLKFNSLKNIPVSPAQLAHKGVDLLIKVGKQIVQSSSIGI